MRGLSAEERARLIGSFHGSADPDCERIPEDEITAELEARGLIRWENMSAPPGMWRQETRTTPLGAHVLRLDELVRGIR